MKLLTWLPTEKSCNCDLIGQCAIVVHSYCLFVNYMSHTDAFSSLAVAHAEDCVGMLT